MELEKSLGKTNISYVNIVILRYNPLLREYGKKQF